MDGTSVSIARKLVLRCARCAVKEEELKKHLEEVTVPLETVDDTSEDNIGDKAGSDEDSNTMEDLDEVSDSEVCIIERFICPLCAYRHPLKHVDRDLILQDDVSA
jgi:hypothetical protein